MTIIPLVPVKTIDGTDATAIDKDVEVELLYKGELRRGIVERGDHPKSITLKTAEGFRQFTRSKIESLSFIL